MHSSNLSLVVLAAGMGRRFGGNKQIEALPGIGKTILELSVEDAYQAGVRHTVLVINAEIESAIKRQILPRLPKDMFVDFAFQEPLAVPADFIDIAQTRTKPWGTGHALLSAKPFCCDNFIVITADDYYGPNAFSQLAEHFETQKQWACVAYPLAQTLSESGGVNRGVCQVSENGDLVSVEEWLNIYRNGTKLIGTSPRSREEALAVDALASMTCWGLTRSIFPVLEQNFAEFLSNIANNNADEFYLPDQIQNTIEQYNTRVIVYRAKDEWIGMTYKDDLPHVSRKIRSLRGLANNA